MTPNPEAEDRIRRYLLGELDDNAQQEFEQELLTNGDLFEELLMLEDELVDEYLGRRMSVAERQRFESHFLITTERQEKLKFGRAFNRHLSSEASVVSPQEPKPSRLSGGWTQAFFSSPFRFAAYAMLVVAVALGVWALFFRQSDVDKSLLALNAAYRQERPIEARISGLNYAPYVATRGPGTERVDQTELRRAELTSLEALNKSAKPAAHHALGKVFLAKKQFDDAIKHFDEALKGQPNNAQLNSDLGAAWLEKGRFDLDKEPGKGMEELGRSLENLTKALQLNPNLLEALFNRALCEEQLTLYSQAENDWQEFLKRDSTSPWASEARALLKRLQERKSTNSKTNDQLLQDFLAAYESQDDGAAWLAISLSRARTGNFVVESLIDDYLTLSAQSRTNEAEHKLKLASYAANLERQRVKDEYTSDLVKFYKQATASDRRKLADARSLTRTANALYNRGEFANASEKYIEAKNAFALAGSQCEVMFTESWIGYSHLRIPRASESIQLFERLSLEFETRNYRSLFAQSLSALADAESSLNEFSRTLDHAGRGLATATDIEDYATAIRCLGQSVSIYLALGNYPESLTSFAKATRLAERLRAPPTLIWQLYFQSAYDFYLLGQLSTSITFVTEALYLANLSGVKLLKSRSLERLGLLSGAQGNFTEAIKSGEQALIEAEGIPDVVARQPAVAHSLLTLGDLNRQAGNPRRAIDYYGRSLEIYNSLNFNAYTYKTRKGKLLALIDLKEYAQAETELTTVLQLYEEFRQKITDERDRDTFFDAGQDTYDIAIDFVYTRDASRAFEYAEASRARSLFEMMNSGARVVSGDRGIELRLESKTTSLGLAEIQTRLPHGVQILQYAVLDDKTLVWVVDRSRIQSVLLPITAAELNQQVQNYVGAITARGTADHARVLNLAQHLYLKLIEPVSGQLNRELQLCIIPDGVLHHLPFAALVSSSGRFLIEDFELEFSPSATVFVSASEKATRPRKQSEKILIVGNPRFDRNEFSSLPDLPEAVKEAEEIAAFYRPNATTLIEEEALASRVKSELTKVDVIHLATHAISNENSPLLSKFLLSPSADARERESGVLQSSEIYELNFSRAPIVVLSACQTGIDRTYRGEGAISLARPFIAAGAPVVVATLWPVESRATTDLMISFHKHRKSDSVSTVEALRRAQLEMLRRQTLNNQSDYTWAAFVAIGGYATF